MNDKTQWTAPDFIWLQVNEYPERTWCNQRVEDDDVCYRRVGKGAVDPEPHVPLRLVEEIAMAFSVTPYGSGVLAAINRALDAGRDDKQ